MTETIHLPSPRRGRVLTFYSYKGGTGRTMALANIAWVLASSGKRVLAIDWDLEAPGLHRYFRPFLIDDEIQASDGLIDLVEGYATQAIRPRTPGERPDPNWYVEFADLTNHVVSVNFGHFPSPGKISLLPAGRQTDRYAIKVNSFDWQNFYDRLGGGGFVEAMIDKARADYDYILIDSRTGVSDTAGICTAQLPDSLVVCFAYNNQGIRGASSVARSAVGMRRKLEAEKRSRIGAAEGSETIPDTPRPFRVFPVPMRVDPSESERLAVRQTYARSSFETLVGHLQPSQIGEYWSNVEIPHVAFYSYEEILAAFKDRPADPKSVLAAFLRLTRYLTDGSVTSYTSFLSEDERLQILEAFAATPNRAGAQKTILATHRKTEEELVASTADFAFSRLTNDEQQMAMSALKRLVRIGLENEGGGYFPIRADLSDFNEPQKQGIAILASAGLVQIATDEHGRRTTLPHEGLIRVWKRLVHSLDEDRSFLIWRQLLRGSIASWERDGRDNRGLLRGRLLTEAEYWLLERKIELNDTECAYIGGSQLSRETFGQHPANSSSETTAGPRKTILVVDDHPLILEAAHHFLKQLDTSTEVIEATTCSEALDQLELRPDINLVLLDLGLPDADGYEALARMREAHPAIAVVVFSANDSKQAVTKALEGGAMGFIPKTTSTALIVSALRLVFDGGVYLPTEILSQPAAAPDAAERTERQTHVSRLIRGKSEG